MLENNEINEYENCVRFGGSTRAEDDFRAYIFTIYKKYLELVILMKHISFSRSSS